MEPLKKVWKDKKQKIYWKKPEKRNREDKIPIGANAINTKPSLSNSSSKKKSSAGSFNIIVAKKVIIPKTTLNPRKIEKTISGPSNLCVYD